MLRRTTQHHRVMQEMPRTLCWERRTIYNTRWSRPRDKSINGAILEALSTDGVRGG